MLRQELRFLAIGLAALLAGCGRSASSDSGSRVLERDEQVGAFAFRAGTRIETRNGQLVRADLRQPHAVADLLVTGGVVFAGGAVTEAILAADQLVNGIWCKGGNAALIDARTRQLSSCTLARPRTLLDVDWPAGTTVNGLNGEPGGTITFELPSGAEPVEIESVAVPSGFRIALDSRSAELRSLDCTFSGEWPYVEITGERLTGRVVFERGSAKGAKWSARDAGRAEEISVKR